MEYGNKSGQDDVAIVVGISCYDAGDDALGDLPGAVRDAIRFRRWLHTVGGVPKNNICCITSPLSPPPNGKPYMDQIHDALDEALKKGRKMRQKGRNPRRLYMYFAGHGFSHTADHVALLMANATRSRLGRSMDMDSYHKALMSTSPFSEQVFFYDCCRRWDMRLSGSPSQWSSQPQSDDWEPENVTQYIYFATGFRQASYETRGLLFSARRGLFTKALLEGLEGGAAIHRKEGWIVTTTTLATYVGQRLRELTLPLGLRQQPYPMLRGPEQPLVLAHVNPPANGHVTIKAIGRVKRISILDASGSEVRIRGTKLRIAEGEAHVDLPAGLYYIEGKANDVKPILVRSGASLVVQC